MRRSAAERQRAAALWPVAIMSVLHRSIILSLNGNITDDFKPVYRAVLNFRHGWDIYNEHFDYVDPHYLYPPGGTLLMAPFGYLPFTPSRYVFILINAVAILIAGDELAREERVELLVFDVVPTVESGFGHGGRCLSFG